MQVYNVTDTSADISWAPRNGVGYEYVLKNDTLDPVGLGTAITTSSYNARGLNPLIPYYFHLRTSCGGGIYSPWEHIRFMSCSLPNAEISTSGKIDLCKGDTLLLSVPYDSNITYQWYFNKTKTKVIN